MRRVALGLTFFVLCFAVALAAAPAPAVHGAPAFATPPAPRPATAPPAWLKPQITCTSSIIQRCDNFCSSRGCLPVIGANCSCSCSC